MTDPAPDLPQAASPRRLGQPRILIVGCGDIGLRIVARLRGRFRVFATVTGGQGFGALRDAGAIPLRLDLDRIGPRARTRARILGLASRLIVLAPTSVQGRCDRRAPHLLRALGGQPPGRLVYISTSGVYGDRRGAWTDETTPAAPGNERAHRRLDAERRLRASAWHAAILRVPGIYGPGRLPLQRLREAIPVPLPAHDIYTNHIHADDLARACIAALARAAPARVYNTVDDTQLLLGQYLDRVAAHSGLPAPPRAPWDELRRAAGPARMSFMSESRRLSNLRMKRELRLRLRYPDVEAGLAALAADQSSNSPSTDK